MACPDEPPGTLTDTPRSAAPGTAGAVAAAPGVAARLLPSRREMTLAGMTLIVAFTVALAAYLVMAVPGAWFPSAKARSFKAAELTVPVAGAARLEGDTLVVAAAPANMTIISLTTDLRSSEFAAVTWNVQGVPDDAEVRMIWKSDISGNRTYQAAVTVASGRLRTVVLAGNPAWLGRIQGIALAIRGPLSAPLRVEGVSAKPFGMPQILAERVHEWLAFEPFSGASINTISGGADGQDLPLPPLVAFAVALAALLLWGAHRFMPKAYACSVPSTLAVLFSLAWFVLDARWMANLAHQTVLTLAQYGGKSTREKHLAAEDSALYLFVEKARAVMPAAPARVFVSSDMAYLRGRAAYHLYPHNVWLEPDKGLLPRPEWLHTGDWLLVYQRHGIQYNPETKSLRWDNGAAVGADVKLVEPGSALFQIR